MMTLSDAHGFRKAVAGICMLLAPLAFLAAAIVTPTIDSTHEGAILRGVASNPDRFYIATLLIIISIVFLVPAVLGLMHMLRERRVAWGHAGGALDQGIEHLGVGGLLAEPDGLVAAVVVARPGDQQVQVLGQRT